MTVKKGIRGSQLLVVLIFGTHNKIEYINLFIAAGTSTFSAAIALFQRLY